MEAGIFSPEGRIRRTVFWLRWLFVFVINIMLRLILERINSPEAFVLLGFIMLLLSAFMIIQGIKRMHDINKSGWNFIIPFYNIILALTPGTPGPNHYGQDPKSDGLEPYDASTPIEKPASPNRLDTDTIIILFLSISAFDLLVGYAIQTLVDNWYNSNYKYVHILLNLVYGVTVIILAVAIKKEKLRVAGIIIAALWFLRIAYMNLDWAFNR
jgi:uncharacterized membrane protein YhaH (DUF805 family)